MTPEEAFGEGMDKITADYKILLADGVVGYTGPTGPSRENEHLMGWKSKLFALAEADGLRAGLFYMHSPMLEYMGLDETPACIQLLHGDHRTDPGPNIYPYDQQAAAAWHRPRAEVELGAKLVAARVRHGV